jgi:uncharacterized delta-60 repeat protein
MAGTTRDTTRTRVLGAALAVLLLAPLLVAVPLAAPAAAAGAGDLDLTYAVDGVATADFVGLDRAFGSALDSGGRLVVVGSSSDNNGEATIAERAAVARFLPGGAPDASFSGDGRLEAPSPFTDASQGLSLTSSRFIDTAIDGLGRVVAVGNANPLPNDGPSRTAIVVRYRPDGTPDASFGGGDGVVSLSLPGAFSSLAAVVVDNAGRIVVAGQTGTSSGGDGVLARLVDSGALDGSFGGGDGVVLDATFPKTFLQSMVIQPDGRIVVGGQASSTSPGALEDIVVGRYAADGGADAGLLLVDGDALGTTAGKSSSTGLALDSAGRVIIAGVGSASPFSTSFGVVGRLTPALVLDAAFGGGDGLVRYDHSPGGIGFTDAAVVDADKILVSALAGNNDLDLGVVRFSANGAVDTTFGTAEGLGSVDVNNADLARALEVQSDGRALVVGANIHFSVARFLAGPPQGLDPGSVVAGFGGGDGTVETANSDGARDILELADGRVAALSNAPLADPNPENLVVDVYTAAGAHDPLVGAGGTINVVTPGYVQHQARALVQTPDGGLVAVSDADDTFNSASGRDIILTKLKADGAGGFEPDNAFGSMPANGTTISDFAGGDEDAADSAIVLPDGRIVVVGFVWNGSDPDVFIARYLANGALDATFNGTGFRVIADGLDVSGLASGVAVTPDGKLVVAGTFDGDNAFDEEVFVLRLLEDGSNDPTFAGGGHFADARNVRVGSVAVQQDGRIVVGGSEVFGCGGSGTSLYAVRVTTAGVLDTTFGGPGNVVNECFGSGFTISGEDIAIQPNGRILLAGLTETATPNSSSVFRLETDGRPDLTFGFRGLQTHRFGGVDDQTATSVAVANDGGVLVGSALFAPTPNHFGYVSKLIGDPIAAPVVYAPSGRMAITSSRTGRDEVFLTDPDGSSPEQVTNQAGRNARDPELSPDASRITFASSADTNDLDVDVYTVNVDGTGLAPLHTGLGYQADPTWSPDGTKVAYSNDPNGSTLFDIYIRNADGSGEVKFSEPVGQNNDWDTFADWSPDGTRIAYQSSPGGPGVFNIKVKPVAGGPAVTLTSAGQNSAPKWSPDGSKIAFTSNRNGNYEVYVMNADGSSQTRLTSTAVDEGLPEWSPDGTMIAFTRVVGDGVEEIHRSLADGTGVVQLTNTVGRNTTPSWVDNLTVSATSSVPSSPTSVPSGYVPLQGQSANVVDTAGIPTLDLLKSPIPTLDLLKSPIPTLDLLKSGIPTLDLLKSPIPTLDLLKSGIPTLDLLKSPIIDGLKGITLPTTPLRRPGGWKTYLATTRLAAVPEQNLTLYDVFVVIKELHDDAIQGNELASFTLGELDLSRSRLGAVSPVAVVLLETPIAAFTSIPQAEQCRFLAAAGFGQCGVDIGGTNATLFELQVAGADISGLQGLDQLRVGDIDPQRGGAQPLARFRLTQMDLLGSNLGQLAPEAAPNRDAVVSCSRADCPTLADAERVGGIVAGATFADLGSATAQLTIKELTLGFIGVANAPIAQLSPTELGVDAYPGAGSSTVDYQVRFVAAEAGTAPAPSLTVDLPDGFTFKPASATAAIGNGAQQPITPVVTPTGDLVFGAAGSLTGRLAVTVRFKAFPGLELGRGRTVSVTAAGPATAQTVFNRAPVTVTESFEPANESAATAPLLAGDTVYLSHIATAADRDLYRVHVDQPGTRIQGFLTPGVADVDLVLYSPIDPLSLQLGAPLRATATNTDAVLPLGEGTRLSSSGEPLAPEAVQDIVLENRPVVGISTNRGTDVDTVDVIAPFAGDYLVQVSGYNGAFSNSAYALRFTLAPPLAARPCAPVSFPNPAGAAGTLPATIGGSTKTLFLMHAPRLAAMFGASAVSNLRSQLGTLAARPEVAGEIWDVSRDAPVAQRYTEWDQTSCDPERANAVVRAINAMVDARTDLANGQVVHVVLVGGDQAIPMARIPDLTQQANERGYAGALAFTGNSSIAAAFERGYQLSDDPYGDARPTPYLNRHLYVSDVGLGRLVESPAEMSRVITSYINAGGVLDPTTALTAGYDFMGDVARDIDAKVAGKIPTAANRTLLVDHPTAGTAERSFTRQELAQDLGTRTPELASINGHYDHGTLLPGVAGGSPGLADDLYTAAQHAEGPDQTGSIFFTMGCHSGVSVSDLLIGAGAGAESTARVRDWAQAQASKAGGAYVGQTGYGVGLDATIALSERILSGFAKNLASGTMTAGQALAFSKQSYLGSLGVYGVYDEKVLTEATMFGLPMWRLGNAAPAPAPTAVPTSIDAATGLPVAAVTVTPTFGSPTSTGEGSFYALDGQVLTTNGRPIQPLTTIDVTQPSATGVARDGVITELVSSDVTGFDPVFARPVVDDASSESELDSTNVAFPSSLVAVTDLRSPQGRRQNLVVVPARFQGTGRDAQGDAVGIERLFSKVKTDVYYSNASDLFDPDILSTQAVRVGTATTFVVRTTDRTDVGAGQVKRVVVMAHDESSNVWKKVELVQDGSDPQRWTGGAAFAGELIEYSAQAVDQSGNVAGTWNKAVLHEAVVQPDEPAGVDAAIVGPAGANGWYRTAQVRITTPPTVTVDVQVDGAAPARYAGPFPITGDGIHTVSYTTSTGDDGVLYVPVDATAPSASITSPTAGATFVQGQAVAAAYACVDKGSGVASCTGTVANGANIDTASPGTKTFTVNSSDLAGTAAAPVTVQYTVAAPVRYAFEGWFSPVDNPPVLNKTNAGQNIPVKWRLRDQQGQVVTSTASVRAIRAVKIACVAGAPVDAIEELVSLNLGVVTYDAANQRFQYNWKTDKTWANSCRRLEVEFDDGQVKTALFSFVK